jgi:aldose 1-epimerase
MAAISDDLINVCSGSLAMGIVPRIGGSLAYFRKSGRDLMRPLSADDRAAGNVLGVACFPMVPYANRIEGNAFDFAERTWHFSANNPPERFNVHGTGWHSAWQAEEDDRGVLLILSHLAPEEPYSYEAKQHFSLSPDGLTVEMQLTNKGPMSMPFGFGLHPWFERGEKTELAFNATHFFMEGPDGVATERLALPPELNFSAGCPLPDNWRNNDYGGWDGKAEIRFAEHGLGLRIEADPVFGHLMLYADPKKTFFCLEPQSNAPCAFNRMKGRDGEAFGSRILAPGQSLEGTIRFLPFTLT